VVHAQVVDVVRSLVNAGLVESVHDLADGGLALAVAELAASGECGAVVPVAHNPFAETPSQVVLATVHGDDIMRRAAAAGIEARRIGTTGGDRLVVGPTLDIALVDLVARWVGALPEAFGRAVAH
jgi:phosphoribosylformylglycinamidine synthase